jgi:Ca2+-binding EF-hand superfamily protein
MTHSNNTFYSDVELVIFLALVIAGVAWFTTVLLLELLPAMVTAFSIEDNIDREAIDKIDIDDRKHRLARALRVCAMIERHGKLHRASDSPSPSVTAEELRSVPSDKLAEWERDAIITFNAFDTDGTGCLSVNELEAKLAVFSGGGSMLAREVVAGCFDLSRDVVTLPMFLQFLLNAQLEEARSGSSLDHFLFSLLDRERRGKVSMARMQKNHAWH